jgi:hypothetical protein
MSVVYNYALPKNCGRAGQWQSMLQEESPFARICCSWRFAGDASCADVAIERKELYS